MADISGLGSRKPGRTWSRAFFRKIMEEVHALARARAANVAKDYVDQLMQLATSIPPDTKASQFNDLEAGNRLELDWLAGKVVALGRELGLPTPANEAVYAILKLYKNGRKA